MAESNRHKAIEKYQMITQIGTYQTTGNINVKVMENSENIVLGHIKISLV